MANCMQLVDLNSSTISTYSCFERNICTVGGVGVPFTSSFLSESQRGPIIEITFNEDDEQDSLTTAVEIDEDAEQKNPGNIGSLTCRVCNKKLSSKYHLKIHMNIHSENPVIFRCEICDHPFKQKSNSKSHEYTHMNREELAFLDIFHAECKPCRLVFLQRSTYKIHVNMHRKIKPLNCQECNKQFVTKRTLNGHMLSQHEDEGTKKKIRDTWKFQCIFPNCGAKFPTKWGVENHSYSHAPKKQFKCTICDKYFQTPKSRNQHAKVHKPDCALKCFFCQKNFSNTWNMNEHLKTHLQEFEFKCQICGKEFLQKQYFNAHMSGVCVCT